MAKLSPLQNVKKTHGTKDQLLAKVVDLLTPNDGESREEFLKRLKYVANAKLLRLVAVGEKVKELGGRSVLAAKIAEFKAQTKDKDYAASLNKVTLPRLLDMFQSLSRKAKNAKPAKAAPAKKAEKPAKAVKAAPAKPEKAAKAAKPAAKK